MRHFQAEVAAVVLQPGLANVCLVTSCMTIVRQRVEVSLIWMFDAYI
jgi:protein pelota